MMMLKIIVVAPTTAVPIKTGFAVALKVLPAPSPFFQQHTSRVFEFYIEIRSPKSRLISAFDIWNLVR